MKYNKIRVYSTDLVSCFALTFCSTTRCGKSFIFFLLIKNPIIFLVIANMKPSNIVSFLNQPALYTISDLQLKAPKWISCFFKTVYSIYCTKSRHALHHSNLNTYFTILHNQKQLQFRYDHTHTLAQHNYIKLSKTNSCSISVTQQLILKRTNVLSVY